MTEVVHVHKVSGISGSENHLLSLLPRLRERGWDIRMLALHSGEPGAQQFVTAMAERGVPVEQERLRGHVDPRTFARLARRFRGVPIVHAHLVHAHLHALPAALLARVPVRIAHHHGWTTYPERRLFVLGERLSTHAATHEIVLSEGLTRYLVDRGAIHRRPEVMLYGIDPGPEPPPPPAEPRLLSLSRLHPMKGIEVLLQAVAAARAAVPELRLEVAGDGPLEEELRRVAPDGVEFLGRVSPVAPLLDRNAVLVVPSRHEGLGMVALEAMAHGRAVIATSVGGLPELVVDGETGLIVPPHDAAALSRAIIELAGDPARVRAMGAAARRRVVTEFAESRPVDRVEALYRAALGGR